MQITWGRGSSLAAGTAMVRIPGPSALPPSIVFPTSVWHRIVAERRKKLLEIASHELKEGGKKENSVSPTTSPSRGAVLTMSQPKHKATYSHTTSLPTPPPTSPSLQNSLITASHRLSPPPPRHLRGPSLGQKEATKVGQREVFSFSRKHNHDTGLEVPSASDGWAAPPPHTPRMHPPPRRSLFLADTQRAKINTALLP